MKRRVRMIIGCALFGGSITPLISSGAQERSSIVSPRPTVYDTTGEVLLQGTVLSYLEDAPLPPIGAHVTLQTSSGTVDVHLGPASYLRSNHFSLSAGDSVRFVGVSISTNQGSVFLARIAQKGNQSIAIRSPRGFLCPTGPARTLPQAQREQTTQQGNAR